MEWVKLMCNFLDHRKVKLIRKEPKGDALVLLWVLLIIEAGKCCRGGALLISENKPYTVETLSMLLAMPKPIIEKGLQLFTELEMIERDTVIRIRNWRKYQSEDKLEMRREKDRVRQQRFREKSQGLSLAPSRDNPSMRSRDVTPENRQEENRREKTTTDSVRILLSQTPLSRMSDQELNGLTLRHGLQRLHQAADVAAETWRRDRGEIRNPGGYLSTFCESLVIPAWYVPRKERQQRADEDRRQREMQTAKQLAQQAAEEVENKARDDLWQSLNATERDQFCRVVREEFPASSHPSEKVVVILAKLKAWEARQINGCS